MDCSEIGLPHLNQSDVNTKVNFGKIFSTENLTLTLISPCK